LGKGKASSRVRSKVSSKGGENMKPWRIRSKEDKISLEIIGFNIFSTLFIFLWLLQPAIVWGGRPLVTEDAGTVDKGAYEVELAFDYSQDNNKDKNYLPSFQLAYGLSERTELALSGGYIFKDLHDNGREDGWSDMVAYLKYRVWGEGDWYPAFTIKPHLKIPTADVDRGLGSGKVDYGLTAVFSQSIGGIDWHFNAGYTLIGEKHATDQLNLGLAGELEITKGIVAVSELQYTQNFNSNEKDDPASFLLGIQAEVGKVIMDAGFTIGLNGAAPDYTLTVGITVKFQ